MTAPVIMENKAATKELKKFEEKTKAGWKMSFVLPANFSYQTAPKPEDKTVKLKRIPSKKVAVVKFSGRWKLDRFNEKSKELQRWLKQKKLTAISAPRSASFNPPWTIPIFRRNEIQIDIK